MCLHLYGHRAISLMGFYNGRVQSRRQTVRSPQPHLEITRLLHGALAASVQRSYGGCVILVYFGAFVNQTCTNITHL